MSRTSAVAAALAVWWGTTVPLPWWTAVGGAVVLLAVVGRVGRVGSAAGGPGRPGTATGEQSVSHGGFVVVMAALWLAGAGLSGARIAMRDSGPLVTGDRRTAVAEAVVVTEPRAGSFDSWMIVRVERFADRRVRQRALLRTTDPPPIGARLRGRVHVGALPEGPFGSHVRGLGAAVGLTPVGPLARAASPGGVLRSTSVLRDRLRTAATAGLPPDRAALLTGLVTGDGRGRSPELDGLLTDAGLRHLVVVSGRHTALFLAGVLGLAFLLRLPFRTARLVTLTALGWFVVLVRWQPSVLRAGVVAGIILLADLLGRDRDRVHLLAVAVLVLLLADPLLGGQLGFLLSVAATAGVLLLAPFVHARLRGPSWWRVGVATAVAAQAAVAPVLVSQQEAVPLGGVAANLIAAPAAAVAQVIGTLAAAAAPVAPRAAALLAAAASWPLAVVLWAARQAARIPTLADVVGTPQLWWVLLVGLGGVVLHRRLHGGSRWIVVVTSLAAVVVLARVPPVETLTVTVLDVGQGDSVLVEVPHDAGGTARMLVDAGPDPTTAARMLARRRIGRLDAVVLTHGHHDHVGGAPAVLRRIDVGLLAGPPPGPRGLAGGMAAAVAAARGQAVAFSPLGDGDVFHLGRAEVTVLSPPPATPGWGENDRSVVLRIDGVHGSVLLTGDIEAAAQRRLLREPGRLRADVLKVPHHGAATNAVGFLAATGADIAVVSVGTGNDYGHPVPSVIAALAGTDVRRTDVDGTLRIELRPGGPVVTTP